MDAEKIKSMRNRVLFLIFMLSGLGITSSYSQALSGVDGLGRILPQQSEVGPLKEGKQVGLFYFLWQGDESSPTSENFWDLTKLYHEDPAVFHDFHHPGWGGGSKGTGKYYFWGEPIYGYYRGDDYWVHLKNIQLLADAQIDFLVIDATNRITYPRQAETLMKAMKTVRDQGKKAPQIVFYTNTQSGEAMQEIYDNFYAADAPMLYPDNWYYLDGKPLIIGVSEEAKGRNYESFFTFRESQWPNEPAKPNGWPWIDFQRPQKTYKNDKGEPEIINVSAAQHPNLQASMGGSAFYGMPGNWGRSYHNNSPGNPEKDIFYGYNIQEQWDYALAQDVPFIFITGWNEWIAGKWKQSDNQMDQAHFVDQADAEYSRDIEPTLTGGLKDHYYMQMISNIRRYKGTHPITSVNITKASIELEEWESIPLVYQDYVGDVIPRKHPGAQSKPEVIYENNTGRNDFDKVKLVVTSTGFLFYVSTVDDITKDSSHDNWMTLWLNTDQSYQSGWFGYDYRVTNGERLQRYINGTWTDVGKLKHTVNGNSMVIDIPFSKLGMPFENAFIEFKWSDNMQKLDPMDWYINGDAAPGGRLNIRAEY